MTAIMLARIDSRRNIARFYKLDIQPTLFGEWSIVGEWGRIGLAPTVRTETVSSRGVADLAVAMRWTKELKKGYS